VRFRVAAAALLALSMAGCAYVLLNPLLGVIEPIPDILPLIGNLDDIAAVYLMWKMWPRLTAAMTEFLEPEVIPEDRRVDDTDYIDVSAETVHPSGAPPPEDDRPDYTNE